MVSVLPGKISIQFYYRSKLSVLSARRSLGSNGLRAENIFLHYCEEKRQLAQDVHIPCWILAAMLHHHRFVFLHIQHCPEAAREVE